PDWLAGAAERYLGARSTRAEEPLRPLDADLSGLPPVHLVAGGDEILVGDSDALVARPRAAGRTVDLLRPEGLWHAYPLPVGRPARRWQHSGRRSGGTGGAAGPPGWRPSGPGSAAWVSAWRGPRPARPTRPSPRSSPARTGSAGSGPRTPARARLATCRRTCP